MESSDSSILPPRKRVSAPCYRGTFPPALIPDTMLAQKEPSFDARSGGSNRLVYVVHIGGNSLLTSIVERIISNDKISIDDPSCLQLRRSRRYATVRLCNWMAL